MQLVEGRRYLLPNGEKVTAKLIEGRFLLEYKRPYRSPLSVGKDGDLMLRGEAIGFRLDSLVVDESEEEGEKQSG